MTKKKNDEGFEVGGVVSKKQLEQARELCVAFSKKGLELNADIVSTFLAIEMLNKLCKEEFGVEKTSFGVGSSNESFASDENSKSI